MVVNTETCAQVSELIAHFNTTKLPFATDIDSFDIWASDDPYIISEREFETYLLQEGDQYLQIRNASKLRNFGYYNYFAVGKFSLSNDIISLLYYRSYGSGENDIFLELILVIFDKNGNLISSLPISGLDTKKSETYYCTIKEDGKTIIVKYYTSPEEEFKFQKEYNILESGIVIEKSDK